MYVSIINNIEYTLTESINKKISILTTKTKINCASCGRVLNRKKTIHIESITAEKATIEAYEKIEARQNSLQGINCKACQSIIDMTDKKKE